MQKKSEGEKKEVLCLKKICIHMYIQSAGGGSSQETSFPVKEKPADFPPCMEQEMVYLSIYRTWLPLSSENNAKSHAHLMCAFKPHSYLLFVLIWNIHLLENQSMQVIYHTYQCCLVLEYSVDQIVLSAQNI